MKSNTIIIACALFFLMVSSNCKKSEQTLPQPPGRTFYIDALNGNDLTGEGSLAKPFRTFKRAMDSLQSNDILLLNNGNYGDIITGRTPGWDYASKQEDITIPYSKFTNWVTIKAAPGQTPHLNSLSIGTLNIPNSGIAAKKIPFSTKGNCDLYMSFENLTIDDGVQIYGSRNVTIKNCTLNRKGDLNGTDAIMDDSAGITILNGRYITLEGNEITHVAIGIDAATYDFVVKNNNIHHNSHDGIRVVGGDTWLIEGNKIHDLDDGVDDNSGYTWNRHVDGMQICTIYDVTNNLTVRGNLIYHIADMGIMINESDKGNHYQNWVFENNIFGPVGGIVLHFGADVQNGLVCRHNTVLYAPKDSWQSLYRTLNGQEYLVAMWAAGFANNGYRFYNNLFVAGTHVPDDYDNSSTNIYYNPSTDVSPYIPVSGSIADVIASGTIPGTLNPNSAAIDAGITKYTTEVKTDFSGNPRDSKPDIGALEKQK